MTLRTPTPELYRKLRPMLRTRNLGASRFDAKRKAPRDRSPFYVSCSRLYCHGGYYGGLEWKPKREPYAMPSGEIVVGDHPTYEQFCAWYRLDPAEGIS